MILRTDPYFPLNKADLVFHNAEVFTGPAVPSPQADPRNPGYLGERPLASLIHGL